MDSRTALLNAPRRWRVAVVFAAPLGLVALVAGAALLLQSVLDARAERIAAARYDLSNLHLLLAADPGAGPVPAAPGDGTEFLAGSSLPLIQAALQARLGEIASSSGADLLAVGNTPVTERDDTHFTGLRASLTGPNAAIVDTLFAIESEVPYLTVRNARIDAAGPRREGDTGDPTLLQMQIEIEGALAPGIGVPP